ncbi:hypothetical protein B5K11_10110 [Rhizobium leguminosarum bv. trifolii]|uniref:hypothetical protein n=1 Tax=Rhizobium leguminosarum TaxID=384 RepID=UPI000E2F88EC|nr:hypothetical protein [Rhizobium leguminosarum]RFB95288.1 hypothetical protein B5K11_10110 [Rhizobium leguminosarum bv. trifolii]
MSLQLSLRWISAFTLQLIALIIVVNFGLSVYSAYEQNRRTYHDEKSKADAERKKATDEIAARCNVILLPGETLRSCIAREVNAYEEKANTDKDLEAQQDVAFWAQAQFWLTITGTAISILGLWFVWQSLRQTRQAISNDREVGHAQVRAYVMIDMPVPIVAPGVAPMVQFDIRNTGQSPAFRVAYIAGFAMMPNPLPHAVGHIGGVAAGQDVPQMAIASGEKRIGEAMGLPPLTPDDMQTLLDGRQALYLFARVFYVDVFGQKHETAFCGYLDFQLIPGHEDRDPRPRMVTLQVDNKRSFST